jgi:23S rRNA pseudouridine1911/1915/1917 synthase
MTVFDTRHHLVAAEETGSRLDVLLAGVMPGLSRSFIKRLMDEGRILVDDRQEKAGFRVKSGQRITVDVPLEPADTVPQDLPVHILYEDEFMAVINKAAGMVVHPAAGNSSGTLVNALLFHVKDLSGIGGVERPGIVHRLDKDTSGLLVVAKHDSAHASLSRQLAQRSMKRQYVALVHGSLGQENGTVDAPIARHPVHRKRMAVRSDGRAAVTHFSVLEDFGRYTLLRLDLETGRTHQIRVHLAHTGHPLLGDILYGGKPEHGALRQMLHACRLTLAHPGSGQLMTFVAEPPEDFASALQRLRNAY